MNDAQVGLIVATPIIVGFAVLLYRMGAVSAVLASVAIASVLFLNQ